MYASTLVMLTLLTAGRDPAAIPPGERIAYVNRLADRLTGVNARKEYEKAQEAYVALWDLSMNAPTEEARRDYSHVDRNLFELALTERWSPQEARAIRDWLEANKSTLKAIEAATRRKRCFRPLDTKGGRLHAVVFDSLDAGRFRLLKLAGITANDFALRGEWRQAYEWNLRAHTMADHEYQQPFSLQRFVAMAGERNACDQLLRFLRRHPPEQLNELQEKVLAGDEFRCPTTVIQEAEALWTRDYIEAWHEWAENPERHPDLSSMVETYVGSNGLDSQLKGLFGNCPFSSVEALRAALRASSVEKDWGASLRADELTRRWSILPFHEALKGREKFERTFCEVVLTAPSLGVFGCGSLTSSRPRFLEEETGMYRTALSAVLGILQFRQKHGRLPKELGELVPEFLAAAPVDPYSGAPLVYRLTSDGGDFFLYSVGIEQVDDGGKHTLDFHGPGDRVFWPPPERPIEREELPSTG